MRNWMLLTKGAVEFRADGSMNFLTVSRQDVLRDLARALSGLKRSGGRRDWSVAQHSLLVARMVTDPSKKLRALLHDCEEAFTGDMPLPWINCLEPDVREKLREARETTRREILRFLGAPEVVDDREIRLADMEAFRAEARMFDKTNLERVERDLGLVLAAPVDADLRGLDLLSEQAVADLWYAEVSLHLGLK